MTGTVLDATIEKVNGDFPGGPVVKTLHASTAGGTGSIPGWGTKILHAERRSQRKKKRRKEKVSDTQSCSRGAQDKL